MTNEPETNQQPQQNIHVFSKEQILNNPLAFGALMEFQYGTGEKQKTAEELLKNQFQGIPCSREDLDWIMPNIDFLSTLKKKDKKDRVSRLYYNNGIPSRLATSCLQQADFDFSTCTSYLMKVHELPLGIGEYAPLPILALEKGFAYGAERIINVARAMILSKLLQHEEEKNPETFAAYKKRLEEKINTRWCESEKRVACFDHEHNKLYEGPAEQAPFPVLEGMKDNKHHWHDVLVWHLGTLDILLTKSDTLPTSASGSLGIAKPNAYLFPHEVKALQKKNCITVHDNGGGIADWGFINHHQEKYFLAENELYRVELRYVD